MAHRKHGANRTIGDGVSRRRVLRNAAATSTVAAGVATPVAADSDVTEPVFDEGRAQPVFADDEVIREDYWVETQLDTDGTGDPDRVHVEIARPASTQYDDLQLPVVMEPSPYYGENQPAWGHPTDVELYRPDKPGRDLEKVVSDRPRKVYDDYSELAEFTGANAPRIGPSPFEEHLLQCGFVWAYPASIGTEQSTGCPSVGGPTEIEGIETVVDWLNGRATAYDRREGGEPVDADWTTGKTGAIGISYNGTLANGVATTGVDGLEAIVPIAAIANWYDYYRANGHVAAALDMDGLFDFIMSRENGTVCEPARETIVDRQDRVTGDYNDWWHERNYLPDAGSVEAAVLVCHGLTDYNVETGQFAKWIDALETHDVPHKVWIHRAGHGDFLAFDRHAEEWVAMLNRWFTRWLFGRENGVMDEPTAVVERESEELASYADWPDPAAEHVTLNFTPGGRTAGGLTRERIRGKPVQERLVDAPQTSIATHARAESSTHRLVYRTDPLAEPVRISGTAFPELRLSFDEPAANVTVALVEYAADGTVEVINRGWMDPQNRKSLDETFALHPPGRPYHLEFDLQAVDRVFDAGSRIGVVVLSTDPGSLLRPPETRVEIALDLKRSSVRVPVVGGESALESALADSSDAGGR
ncbi:Xaa-Pro dipeptidyl-peptidase [Halopiger djelfimassiliensis]|uniref:Xaa-Pro dipeptidyl-peptidase n=1 Tax=Halopiger djelfimassiliensis TaxID=1293047 RepID=UPI000677E367|nr:Xaa-Pro dipeptidyl-peptidase [Halopiger djelfimassiliensis]